MPLELLTYQVEGARFLASKHRAGLFDEMGVGKTAQVIHALDLVKAKRTLVVCPAAVREVWKGEFTKFSLTPRRVLKAKNVQDLNLWLRGRADVLLLSYELALSWHTHIEKHGDLIDVVVFDEAHYLKNDLSRRTRAMLGADCVGRTGMAAWGVRVWFITGTPNPNDAADIWSMMRFCGATRLDKRIFRDRYYNKRVGAYSATHDPRADMAPELRHAIRSFSLRRTKRDVNLQIPPIWLTTTTVDGDTREIAELLRQYPDLEEAILAAVERGGLSTLHADHIATLRRLVAEAKAPAFAELLVEELDSGLDKVVVFGQHIRALGLIKRSLEARKLRCVHVDGSTPDTARKNAVEEFQRDPDCRVFLGNIRAAGTGLTLVAANNLIMFESSWSPADNAQAIMRVHRIGQERHVHARFITLANSIDEQVSKVVARKTAAIAKTGMAFEAA